MARVRGITYPYGDVGNRLGRVRKDLGLSQTQFAERLGVHWQTISRMETGQRKIDAEVLVNLCEMGYDSTWLLTGRGDMHLGSESEIDRHKLLAEYWQKNYSLLETAVNMAYKRLVDKVGEEETEKIFKEVKAQSIVNRMSSDPARKADNPTKVIKKGK